MTYVCKQKENIQKACLNVSKLKLVVGLNRLRHFHWPHRSQSFAMDWHFHFAADGHSVAFDSNRFVESVERRPAISCVASCNAATIEWPDRQ